METGLARWLTAMSIRWKLQLSFFLVTVITTVITHWLAYNQMAAMLATVKESVQDPTVIRTLDNQLSAYVSGSFWQSATELAILFVVIAWLANHFVAPIKNLCRALRQIEQGDLTVKVENQSRDEIGILEHAFNAMLTNLNEIMRSIDDTSKQMASSSFQVATISREISEVSKTEQSRAEHVSNASQQLHHTAEGIQRLTEEATERARTTERSAREGIARVRQNITQMEQTVQRVNRAADEMAQLNSAAQQIYDIIATIQTIAEQTNLLALNAAIEAARAGDQGRGFAVVAGEVRNLAGRTTASTTEITDIINRLTQQVNLVGETMRSVVEQVHSSQSKANEITTTIEGITKDIAETSATNQQIADTSRSQMQEFQLLQTGLHTLFATFQENAAKVETTATIGTDLHLVSDRMNNLLSRFTFDHATRIEASHFEQRRAPRMDSQLRVHISGGDGDGADADGITADLSMTGMRIRLRDKLPMKKQLRFQIFIPYESMEAYQNQKPIDILGEVVWQRDDNGTNTCGVHFGELNEHQLVHLRQCFKFYNRKPDFSSEAA